MKTRFEQISKLKLPRRFAEAEISDITNPILHKLATDFTTDFDKWYSRGVGPGLFGPPGIGKTYTCAAIAKYLEQEGVPVMWAGIVKTLNKLLDLRDFRKEREYFIFKKDLTSVPVVVFDDFSHIQDYERKKELFHELIDTRYVNKMCTMFTANFEITKNENSWNEISKKLSPSITRRVREMCKGLSFVMEAGG